jgi:hypothetical protein
MNARQFLSAIATTAVIVASVLPIFGKVELTSNNNSIIPGINVALPAATAAGYMDDYFANGNIVSLNNYGQYLNLHFLQKGGMIQSSNADGTDDQKFRVIRKAGTNQIQLERINSARFIITPSAYTNQAPLEAWQRNESIPFHPMQTWYVDVARTPGTFWLKPLGAPQFALNLPFGKNNVKSTLANFDPNDRDMEWNVQVHSRGNGNPTPQPQPVVQPQTVQPTPQPVVTTQPKKVCPGYLTEVYSTDSKYEAVIAAIDSRKINKTHPGHAIFGLIKTSVSSISNGSCGVEKLTQVLYKTVGAKGGITLPGVYNSMRAVTVLTASKVNSTDSGISSTTDTGYDWDMQALRRYYNAGVPKYTDNWVYLRKEISAEKYNSLNSLSVQQIEKLTGCYEYNVAPLIGGSSIGYCHCGDVSARMYGQATGNWAFNKDTKPWVLYRLITKY